jgi:hypothetical protein
MPHTHAPYGGRYDLPVPPPEQVTVDNTITLDQLQLFGYAPVHLDAFELWAFIERQWKLRKALLEGVHRRWSEVQSAEEVQPEFLPVSAGVLYWMASFEQWLRMSFLRGIFENPKESHDLLKEQGQDERAFILGSLGQLYDHIFETLRTFFLEIHYTHELGNLQTTKVFHHAVATGSSFGININPSACLKARCKSLNVCDLYDGVAAKAATLKAYCHLITECQRPA